MRTSFAALPFLLLPALLSGQGASPLDRLPSLSTAVSKRISSWDKSGKNTDFISIKAGETVTLAAMEGAGSIRHIWVTINSEARYHLRELVLRMYWDGETDPSVETPIGDFFGTGFGEYTSWHSLPVAVQGRAMNAYFPMPFARGARITLTNDGTTPVKMFYYHIDYEAYPNAKQVEGLGRFHAQFRREDPTGVKEGTDWSTPNTSDRENYLFVEAEGQGHFVGVVLNVQGLSTGWWGEGDDMFFVDGEKYPPAIHGTGLEDYFLNAWGFQDKFDYPFYGYSRKGNADFTGMHTMYRWHIPDPIHFKKSLRASIEHGHANDRGDDYSSVAFWYQTEPHKKFDALPGVKQRYPHRNWKVEVNRRP